MEDYFVVSAQSSALVKHKKKKKKERLECFQVYRYTCTFTKFQGSSQQKDYTLCFSDTAIANFSNH